MTKTLEDESVKEWLKGCILIPSDKWFELSDNSHISYVKKDGAFVKGGFIKLKWEKDGTKYFKYGTKLSSWNGDKYYKEFTLNLDNVESMYKRISQDAIFEYKLIKYQFEDKTQKLQSEVDSLKEELATQKAAMLDSVRKIAGLIKKLHGIKSLEDI